MLESGIRQARRLLEDQGCRLRAPSRGGTKRRTVNNLGPDCGLPIQFRAMTDSDAFPRAKVPWECRTEQFESPKRPYNLRPNLRCVIRVEPDVLWGEVAGPERGAARSDGEAQTH